MQRRTPTVRGEGGRRGTARVASGLPWVALHEEGDLGVGAEGLGGKGRIDLTRARRAPMEVSVVARGVPRFDHPAAQHAILQGPAANERQGAALTFERPILFEQIRIRDRTGPSPPPDAPSSSGAAAAPGVQLGRNSGYTALR